jgi:mannosyltransferase
VQIRSSARPIPSCPDSDWGRREFPSWAFYLIAVILAGTLLRVFLVEYRTFWLDELYSVAYAKFSFRTIFWTQMPLYFLLLHLWLGIFGDSDVPARLFSVLWGSIGLAGFAYLLRCGLAWSKRTVLIAVSLLAVSPFHFYYSIEARSYAMLFALSTFYLSFLLQMHAANKKRYLLAFALLQAMLLYSHNIAPIYCLTINISYILFLFVLKEALRERIGRLVSANLLTLLLYLPSVWNYFEQVRSTYENFWAQLPSFSSALKIWGSIILFWSPELVEWISRHAGYPVITWTLLFVPTFVLMCTGVFYALRSRNLPELLVISSLFVYPGVIYAVSLLIKPLMLNKILLPSLIGLPVLLLIPMERGIPRKNGLYNILIPYFFVISVGLTIAVVKEVRDVDWHNVVSIISHKSNKNDLVLFYRNYGSSLFRRYSRQSDVLLRGVTADFEEELRQRSLQGDLRHHRFFPVDSAETVTRLDRIIDGRKNFFLVLSPMYGRRDFEAERDLLKNLRAYRIEDQISINNAKIYQFSRR